MESKKLSRCSTLWEKVREKKFFKKLKVQEIKCRDTSTASQVSNSDRVVLEIYFDHKLQWPQDGLNCKSLEYEVVT